ncbi:hypothetical protein SBV1_2490018 [Verrucomicrobia bacterium]|nr:hypothetical protein SBV1_2490018 [Verrucomicrobiota bacterium]
MSDPGQPLKDSARNPPAPGASVQAAGPGSVAVGGSVINSTIQISVHNERNQPTVTSSEESNRVLAEAEAAYRQHIVERFGKLTLYSVTSDAPLAVDLERVFVSLTVTKRQRNAGDVTEALRQLEERGLIRFDPSRSQQSGPTADPAMALTGFGTGKTALAGLLLEKYHSLTSLGAASFPMAFATKGVGAEPVTLSVSDALRSAECLAIIGAPGAGKTTLLKYLALTFSRKEAKSRLGLEEHRLPVFVALRDFNRFLSNLDKQGKLVALSPLHLPRFLDEHTHEVATHVALPEDFFARALSRKECVVLLDGLDEVADPLQRGRTAETVAAIIREYAGNRFVLTSRPRGFESEARQRLAPFCSECTIREFDQKDRTEFARSWYTAVITEREGDNKTSRAKAESAAEDLLRAIHADARITTLASNPLLLSILALVHQKGVGLPQRRAELYDECTQMLLGYWDQTKGGEAARELAKYGDLDRGDKRALLEPVALWLHERGESGVEVTQNELAAQIALQFQKLFGDPEPQSSRRAQLFLRIIAERAGLLIERENGVYAFAHLTFQEYLAARAPGRPRRLR